MRKVSNNVHEQAMWEAMQELKSRRMRAAGRMIPITFLVGWAVILFAAIFN